MFTRKFVLTASPVIVLALLGAASTQAWSSLPRTNHLTFSAPVALPGVVLPAGSYTFEAGPQDTDPTLVRVLTRNGGRPVYQGFTTRVSRPAPMRAPVVMFGEAPAGQPIPISIWYPAHSNIGYQFRH